MLLDAETINNFLAGLRTRLETASASGKQVTIEIDAGIRELPDDGSGWARRELDGSQEIRISIPAD